MTDQTPQETNTPQREETAAAGESLPAAAGVPIDPAKDSTPSVRGRIGGKGEASASPFRPEDPTGNGDQAVSPVAGPLTGLVLNQTALAAAIRVTDVTLWEWQKLGMPVLKRGVRGQENLYDLAEVFFWKVEHEVRKASGGESAKDRLARLQADKIERELQQMDRILIPAEQLEPALLAIMSSISQALDAMTQKLKTSLESSLGVPVDLDLIREEVDDVRSKLPDDIVARIASGLAAADPPDNGTDPAAQENLADAMG